MAHQPLLIVCPRLSSFPIIFTRTCMAVRLATLNSPLISLSPTANLSQAVLVCVIQCCWLRPLIERPGHVSSLINAWAIHSGCAENRVKAPVPYLHTPSLACAIPYAVEFQKVSHELTTLPRDAGQQMTHHLEKVAHAHFLALFSRPSRRSNSNAVVTHRPHPARC